jgi:Kef-type K+ transport system membrane component KefB
MLTTFVAVLVVGVVAVYLARFSGYSWGRAWFVATAWQVGFGVACVVYGGAAGVFEVLLWWTLDCAGITATQPC